MKPCGLRHAVMLLWATITQVKMELCLSGEPFLWLFVIVVVATECRVGDNECCFLVMCPLTRAVDQSPA